MVNEVNKLIFNKLISGGAIALPDVGTIFICRDAAKEIARNRVAAPYYRVSFSSHQPAVSLVQIIESVAATPNSQAMDIYSRWLDKVRSGDDIVIEGIGTLRNKSFIVDDSFAKVLNPIDDTVVSIARRGHGGRGIVKSVASLFVLLVILLGGWYAYDVFSVTPTSPSNDSDSAANKVIEVVETIADHDVAADDYSELESQEQGSVAESNDVADDVAVVESNDWRICDNIRHWVVIGSYSTVENAKRAISSLEHQYGELFFDYFKLGSMYAVSPCGAEDRATCEEFTRTYAKDFAQMWIHTPKKYKE